MPQLERNRQGEGRAENRSAAAAARPGEDGGAVAGAVAPGPRGARAALGQAEPRARLDDGQVRLLREQHPGGAEPATGRRKEEPRPGQGTRRPPRQGQGPQRRESPRRRYARS